MKLFVFAIGGTGSRVLRSMVMQFAAGVVPRDANGNPIKNLTVVPIIIDPHYSNAALVATDSLLKNYRDVRNELYGNESRDKGFFAVRIETLKKVGTSSSSDKMIEDSFIFNMNDVSTTNLEGFIDLRSMDQANRLFTEMIFSREELEKHMKEGFYGSPNIGTVALRIFQESDGFSVLANAVEKGDRMFFIGSIFGGTGAAGMPMLISSIRQSKSEKDSFKYAPIGAMIMMPYFSIEKDDDSPISEADFIIKTKTALRYYIDNLNPYVNDIYYIADEAKPRPFRNDPGDKENQKSNLSHFAEFVGALAIADFLSQKFDNEKAACPNNKGNRIEANKDERRAHQYGLNIDNQNESQEFELTYREFDKKTRDLIMLPTMKFHLLDRYIQSNLEGEESQTFAKDHKILRSSLSSALESILKEYEQWIFEMSQHGEGAHNLRLFTDLDLPATGDYKKLFNGINYNTGFRAKELTHSDAIRGSLNDQNSRVRKEKLEKSPMAIFLQFADEGFEDAIKKTTLIDK